MRDQKVAAKRANFILLVGGGLFVVTLLAIFVVMLIYDVVGLARALGFVIGIPVAFVVAAFGATTSFQWAADRGRFDEPDVDDEGEGPNG